jgi:hypothetical protein
VIRVLAGNSRESSRTAQNRALLGVASGEEQRANRGARAIWVPDPACLGTHNSPLVSFYKL